jgi:1-phosphatidylinositol-3-phosphate 5-kinase
VREDEPSTIIAYTLSSEDYIEKMHDIQEYGSGSNSDTMKTERRAPSEVTAIDSTVQTPAPPTDIQETLLRVPGTHMRYSKQDTIVIVFV